MSSQVRATLQFFFPDGHQHVVSLRDGDSIKVGREGDNDVVLDEAGVSRVHASFDCSSFGVVVTDLASLNGTFLNGEQISSTRDLNSKDVVNIGPVRILVSLKAVEAVPGGSRQSSQTMTMQLKAVTVVALLVTIRQWRRINESLPEDAVQNCLDDWQEKVGAIVRAQQGRIDKLVEESMVVIWNCPKGTGGIHQAIQAAQEIQQLSQQFNESELWPVRGDIPWEASTVISSGKGLQAGHIAGLTEQECLSMMKDPIKTAIAIEARVNESGYMLLMDEDTAREIESEFSIKTVGKVQGEGDLDQDIFSIE